MTRSTMRGLLTHSMMTPMERARGRFMRAPDGHGSGGGDTFTKADLDKAVKDAVAEAVEEATGGLKSKNQQLMDELKAAKKGKAVDPAELERLEAERDELQTKLSAADRTVKDAVKAKETAEKALQAESGFTHKLLVENGLREQLAAQGVTNAVHQKAAMAMLAGQVQIAADGDTRVAKVGDKVLADFVKEWSAGDEGKHFVSAPSNSGGGASGGKGGGSGKTMTSAAFDALAHGERTAFAREGGTVVDAVV